MTESVLSGALSLEKRLEKLAFYMVENGEPIKAGQLAVIAGSVKLYVAHLDRIAAHYNSRPLRRGLHGVREDEKHETEPVKQMQLLQES